MPASIRTLRPILRCPVCHQDVDPGPPVRCTNSKCKERAGFQLSRGQAVLINFDRSIFTSENYSHDGGSVLPRETAASSMGKLLRQVTYGSDEKSSAVVQRFWKRLLSVVNEPQLLVIGGGTIGAGMSDLYRFHPDAIIGVDAYASDQTALICDAHDLPFIDECFDGVVIQAVLEHVVDPSRVADEIYRVLRRGGLVLADTPFMQQVHEGAYDFTRFTKGGHRWLFRRFEEIDSGVIGGPGTALLWSISYFVRALGAGPKLTAIIAFLFSWVRPLERFMDPKKSADAASATYFIGAKGSRTMAANELPLLYHSGESGQVTGP